MENAKILLVDDKPENLLALDSLLRREGVEIHRANSGVEALELLLQHEYAVALVDVQMPDMDGFELAELMRGTERTRPVPIIFVTAGAHSAQKTFQGYDSGAVDFLNKPLDPHVVTSKVQVFLELARKGHIIQNQLLETQDALRERDRALVEAREALQSRDEFLSIASHELNTPLTGLLLQLQMLQHQAKKLVPAPGSDQIVVSKDFVDRVEKALSVSYRQGKKLSVLIDELLDLTRIRLGKLVLSKETVDLCALANETIERIKTAEVKKPLDLTFQCPPSLSGYWDPLRIDQVITNLLSNAVKYGNKSPIKISITHEGDSAVIVVSDEGLGIAPEMQEKVFQRFERAQAVNHFSGLGLGLYITRQIVEAHGGQITVKSALNKGSEFTVRLPLQA